MSTLHAKVIAELSRAQVTINKEAARLKVDRMGVHAVMFAGLVDMLVANVLAIDRHGTATNGTVEDAVVKRFRAVLKAARDELRGDNIVVPDMMPPGL